MLFSTPDAKGIPKSVYAALRGEGRGARSSTPSAKGG